MGVWEFFTNRPNSSCKNSCLGMKITAIGIFHPNIGHSYQPAHGPRCWSAWGKIEESRPSDWPCHFRTTRHWPADQPVRQFSLQRACLARTELEAEHQGLDVPPKLKADLIETVVELMREDGFEDDFREWTPV